MKQLALILIPILTSIILFAQNVVNEQYIDAYVVIADTSQDYYELRDQMFFLSDKLQFDIDTMDRGYNKAKDLICLPEDHEDGIYAGDYFPRRYPTEALSLEYLDFYAGRKKRIKRTIALVVTITNNQQTANAALEKVKIYNDSAHIIETSIYMGCMH